MRGPARTLPAVLLLCLGTAAAPPALAADAVGAAASRDEQVRGREQLVRAIDAAWIRVTASGKDREIRRTLPAHAPGAAQRYVVSMVDCLPNPEGAPFPEKPVGLLRDILERGVIRRGTQTVPETPGNTSYWFSGISDAYLDAVIDEINAHYGVTLKIEDVALPPGPAPTTSLLVDGKADFIDQLNATGGETQDLRRRISRRFTCTMTASSQYIHVPASSKLADEIRHLDDLIARPGLRICAGPLTTQTARAFLPGHRIKTRYTDDLSGCDADVEAGKADLIMNPLPDLAIAGVKGYVNVPTHWYAGTPLWVALEGISCPSDGNPRTPDRCVELSPP